MNCSGYKEKNAQIGRLVSVSPRTEAITKDHLQDISTCETYQEWDVLRFSGWACDGSKRTIKIWSFQSAAAYFSEPHPCRIGVLSSRCVRHFRRDFFQQPSLLVYQPRKLPHGLRLLEDADLIEMSETQPYLTRPGVTCDLLLSSLPTFKDMSGALNHLKSALLSKWTKLSRNLAPNEVASLLYSSTRFPAEFLRALNHEFENSTSKTQAHRLPSSISGSLRPLVFLTVMQDPLRSRNEAIYGQTVFLASSEGKKVFRRNESPRQKIQNAQNAKIFLDEVSILPIQSQFSGNSKCYHAQTTAIHPDERLDVFVKSGAGIHHEASILPTLRRFYPPQMLQNLLAYDKEMGRLIYTKFTGHTCGEAKLNYLENCKTATFKDDHDTFGRLVDIELAKAETLLDVQLETMRPPHEVVESSKQPIHRFYYDRLHGNVRLQQFYAGMTVPEFLQMRPGKTLSLQEFMSAKLIINGTEYASLEEQCRHAEAVLDPYGKELSQCSVALGLGDSHGGNVMMSPTDQHALLLIDYEVAGFHNPFQDLAKSLYNDSFFSVLYRDLLGTDKSVQRNPDWRVSNSAIHIQLDMKMTLLERVLGFIKLNYTLLPIIKHLRHKNSTELDSSYRILGAALFSCALLTRDFAAHPEAFFMNCAFAVVLMNELKESLQKFFNWSDRPITSQTATEAPLVSNATSPEGLQVYHIPEALEKAFMGVMLFGNLQPDTVYLKRPEQTFELFRKDSRGNVLDRIAKARKCGMDVGTPKIARFLSDELNGS